MDDLINPRSVLHALEPVGLCTPAVESLTSYFCRLAHSHGMAAVQLAKWILERHSQAVPDDFKWNQRNFTSSDAETERWAAWLSELTGIGSLDQMSLVPWRNVLSPQGLMPKSDRWCPCCLAEEHAVGNEPYLRLSWDIAPVTVCLTHKVELTHQCPHCKRSNVRNRSSVVVPGYCTACGGFLGDAVTPPATPEALWVARQIELMLANPPIPLENTSLAETLTQVVARMAGGNIARFAQKLGLSKSGVWHWVNRGGMPTIRAWLDISLHGGIALHQLMQGNLEGWIPPIEPPQLSLPLPESARKGIPSRVLDWDEITAQLRAILKEEIPIPLIEACTRIDVDIKLLYLRANKEARALSARYRQYELQKKAIRENELRKKLEDVMSERLAQGYEGMSARDIREHLVGTEMANVRNTFALIKQVREKTDG